MPFFFLAIFTKQASCDQATNRIKIVSSQNTLKETIK